MTISFIVNKYVVQITVHDYLNCKVIITDHANYMVGYKGSASKCSEFATRKLGTCISIY